MERNEKMKKIGIILTAIGVVFFILDKVLEVESLTSITNYGRYIFASGFAFLAMGTFAKKKKSN